MRAFPENPVQTIYAQVTKHPEITLRSCSTVQNQQQVRSIICNIFSEIEVNIWQNIHRHVKHGGQYSESHRHYSPRLKSGIIVLLEVSNRKLSATSYTVVDML